MIGLLVQCSTVALYPLDDVATCVSVTPKIRSFPKIFLGTFENVASDKQRFAAFYSRHAMLARVYATSFPSVCLFHTRALCQNG